MGSPSMVCKDILIEYILLANSETDVRKLDEIKENLLSKNLEDIKQIAKRYINKNDKMYSSFLAGYATGVYCCTCCNDEANAMIAAFNEIYDVFGIEEPEDV